MKPIAFAE